MQQHPRDLAGSWLEQAKRDIDAARYLHEGGCFDAACSRVSKLLKKR
jgi:HEPN domain-containing protein